MDSAWRGRARGCFPPFCVTSRLLSHVKYSLFIVTLWLCCCGGRDPTGRGGAGGGGGMAYKAAGREKGRAKAPLPPRDGAGAIARARLLSPCSPVLFPPTLSLSLPSPSLCPPAPIHGSRSLHQPCKRYSQTLPAPPHASTPLRVPLAPGVFPLFRRRNHGTLIVT